MRQASFADRDSFYGDPDFVPIPGEILLSDTYNNERRKLIGERASLEQRPGHIPGFGGKVHIGEAKAIMAGAGEPTAGRMGAGEPTVGRLGEARGDTVHFDIIDARGNMISSTPSGGWLQSSPVIPELGFCLGTRAQMFWLDENHPAALAPGKRPRTDAVADARVAPRRALSRLGYARRRSAGSMDLPVPAPAHPRQAQSAAGDRCARLAFGAFPDLVLAAPRAPAFWWWRGACRRPR